MTEAIHSESIDGEAVTVLLPPEGGYGHWLYGKTHMGESFITPYISPTSPTSPTRSTTTEGMPSPDDDSSGSGESDNGDAGTEIFNNAIAAAAVLIPMALLATAGGVGTCIVLHKKKVGCMLKCRTHQSKHRGVNTTTNDETKM